jgi:HAMP domain-containing protein
MFHSGELDGIFGREAIGKRQQGRSRYRSSVSHAPVVFQQPVIMHIGRSLELQEAVMHEHLLFYLYSVPLILAISAVLGWFLASRALKPFEEITATAEKITYENLNTKIVTAHKEKEIQRLVQSFNAMVKRLDDSFRQMRKFNADAASRTLCHPQEKPRWRCNRRICRKNYVGAGKQPEELGRRPAVNDLLTLPRRKPEAGVGKGPTDIRIFSRTSGSDGCWQPTVIWA